MLWDNDGDRVFLCFNHFVNSGSEKGFFSAVMNNRIQRWNIMLKSIGIGAESFHELIESNSYYVDKTPFIRTVFKHKIPNELH